jgi:hypothetical protein
MLRTIPVTLLVLATWAAGVRAQVVFPGSTVEGDYLRGVGFAAIGMGFYNYNTARANSINTDTAIRFNEYVSAVVEYQTRKYWARRWRLREQHNREYQAILQRIREHPEEREVQSGDALNAVMNQLLDPSIGESAYRFASVPLSVDVIRRIPFKLDAENLVFSMQRLTAKGKAQWPPALQGDQFAAERRAYERALDTVLEQQIEGKMTIAAIRAVQGAVDDLFRKLDQELGPSREKLYLQAKNRLTEFKKTAQEVLESHKMQLIMGQLDRYGGTTVRDLLVFMEKNKLGFAGAQTAEERGLYPELYAALVQQRAKLKTATDEPAP